MSPGLRARVCRVGASCVPGAAAAFLALLASACAPEPATAIAVTVKTDLMFGSELSELNYRVFADDADPDFDEPISEFTAAAQTIDRPFIITRKNADEFLISVEGYGPASPHALVVHRERVRFEAGKTLALHVFLARVCYGNTCAIDGLTCYGEPFGRTQAGVCDTIPGPRPLDRVERPGDESMWEPMTSPALDAGPRIPGRDATDGGYRRPDASCSGAGASYSCSSL